jgi:hypothetical protein
VVQGLEAASSGAGAQHGIGWWHGGPTQRRRPVITIVTVLDGGGAVKWSWRRGGIDRGLGVRDWK